MPQVTVAEVLQKRSLEIMAWPGVVGVGEGECAGSPCIRIYVVEKTPEVLERIPETLDGYLVRIEESGEIRPLGR